MILAFLYLVVMLIQVCKQGKDIGSEYEDYYTNSYYYTEEHTNSKYNQSDDENSLVDKRFGYNQSLNHDDSSRRSDSPLGKKQTAPPMFGNPQHGAMKAMNFAPGNKVRAGPDRVVSMNIA